VAAECRDDRRVRLGPYLLIEKIGSGGMAEVWLAKRTGPGGFEKRLAIKKILPHLAADPRFVRMFVDEARVAARLAHPNVVQVFDFGEADGTPFLAMEYVPGITVATVLRAAQRDRSAVPLPAAAHVAISILRGLDHLHGLADDEGRALGLIHRDVSPSNVLVGRAGEVKLGDFGLAREEVADAETDRGRIRGKLGYLAPEQVVGRVLDHRVDLFAAMAVFAELCIGRPLFAGGSELDVLLRIRDGDISPIRDATQSLGRDMVALFARALAADPALRFPHAIALCDEIQAVLAARGMRADAEGLVAWCERAELFVARPTLPPPPGEDPTPEVAHTASMEVYIDPIPESIPAALERADPRTSPAVYRLVLPGGASLGAMSYPKLVEMLTSGEIDADALVSVAGQAARPVREIAEMTRFVTSAGLSWNADELVNVAAKGDIAKVSIPRLLFRLATNGETGVLHLRHGARRKKVYFVKGQPEFVGSSDRSELLGEYLVRERICLRMEVDMALAMLPRFGGHLGDALVGLGILRPIELFRAIAAQCRARLLEMFRWRRGEFVYAIGMRSHEETFPLGVDTYEVIGEGVAAAYGFEELEALLAPFQEKVLRSVPIPRVPIERFALSKRHESVLRSIDGRRTLAGLLARESVAGGADPEEVYQAVYLGLSCEMLEA